MATNLADEVWQARFDAVAADAPAAGPSTLMVLWRGLVDLGRDEPDARRDFLEDTKRTIARLAHEHGSTPVIVQAEKLASSDGAIGKMWLMALAVLDNTAGPQESNFVQLFDENWSAAPAIGLLQKCLDNFKVDHSNTANPTAVATLWRELAELAQARA